MKKRQRSDQQRGATCLLSLLLVAVQIPRVTGGQPATTAGPKTENAETSELWGKSGEAWAPQSRLPDFSFAGYHCGEEPIPDVPVVANVKDLGAKGDGQTDDTEAFLTAIKQASGGAILIPQGRYKLTKVLQISKRNLVLRGEGPDKTVLYFPKPLKEIGPASGWEEARAKMYYYQYGVLFVLGNEGGAKVAEVTAEAKRGDTRLVVSNTEAIAAGQMVRLIQHEREGGGGNAEGLAQHLYAGTRPSDETAVNWTAGQLVDWVVKVKEVQGNKVVLERPLRVDVRPEWKAEIWVYKTTAEEIGIEKLAVEFPNVRFIGPFQEPGYNAISLQRCINCWVRDVKIVDSHNAIFVEERARYCTVENVRIVSTSQTGEGNITALHAFEADRCQDCLFTGFRIETCCVYDIKVQLLASGNVFSRGKGLNLNFDHHGEAPYENLFTDIDAGKGSRLWVSGGRNKGGARETFWNVRVSNPQSGVASTELPNWPQCNVIALWPAKWPSQKPPPGQAAAVWAEAIDPAKLAPQDLHKAQLSRRLQQRVSGQKGGGK